MMVVLVSQDAPRVDLRARLPTSLDKPEHMYYNGITTTAHHWSHDRGFAPLPVGGHLSGDLEIEGASHPVTATDLSEPPEVLHTRTDQALSLWAAWPVPVGEGSKRARNPVVGDTAHLRGARFGADPMRTVHLPQNDTSQAARVVTRNEGNSEKQLMVENS